MISFILCTGVRAQVKNPPAFSSSTTVNYIRVWDARAPELNPANLIIRPLTDVQQSTQYFDGLGRAWQTVVKQGSPLKNDMVTASVYDSLGREKYKYLPFTSNFVLAGDVTNDGNFKLDAFQQDSVFSKNQYSSETYYYSQVNYEKSPLERVLNNYATGNSWVGGGRSVASQYLINALTDSIQLWSIGPSQGISPTRINNYPAGQLHKNVTIDERNNQVVEYKDKEEHVILKKVQLASSPGTAHAGWLNTYYVYDTLHNLRFIIPPKAVDLINTTANNWAISQSVSSELCFRYEYDTRNRIVIKKIPGSGEVWIVYDARERVVMIQDSSLRLSGKWNVTEYDKENRPVRTGLLTDGNNRAYHQNLASSSSSYPNTSGGNYEVLTQTYYDDYSWTGGAGLISKLDSTYNNNASYFFTSYNSSPTYAQKINANYQTRGLITGSMAKVIGTTSQYLYTVSFYDDHNRVIQTQSINYTGGKDTVTTQYDFSGKVLRTLLSHQKSGNTTQTHSILTKLSYDSVGRLKMILKNIDHAASDQIIDSMQYNEQGQLMAKYLGTKVDTLLYDYNIRGWLTGINKNYVAGVSSNHFFGMELGYDKTSSVAPGNTYAAAQYSGNITGTVWKSAGSNVNRKYDFTYDNTNRFSSANFSQYNGSGFDTSSHIDFSVSNLSYDANGNILTMNQKGFTVGGSFLIDQLTYTYQSNSNKLSQVTDAVNNPTTLLGDFHYSGTKGPRDYNYDGNGNLISDTNKAISSIIYNYLNLPQQIHLNSKGNIMYTYDASGNKLVKTVMDSAASKKTVTTYIDGLVYQNTSTLSGSGTDTLQFISHEEGRARWAFHKYTNGTTAYRQEYDFFEKDQLGNTRMVLTQQRDTAIYLASMEGAYRATETQLFGNNISTTAYARTLVSGYPVDTAYTKPNDSVSRVDYNGSGGQKVGPSLLLKVMSGDTISLLVQSYYNTISDTVKNSSFNDVLTSLANGLVNVTGGAHGGAGTFTSPGTSVYTGLFNFLNTNDPPPPTGYPKAYLNWIFLDDQFNYDSTMSSAVKAASATYPAAHLNTVAPGGAININKNGYLYIWVSNETQNWDVFFDNLKVMHKTGPLLEENHYYPFGLTMAGISDKAVKTNYAENFKRYNGIEYDSTFGVDEYEAHYRDLDPQTGRWWQIDPEAEKERESLSPYASMSDDPVFKTDPWGNEDDGCCGFLKQIWDNEVRGASKFVNLVAEGVTTAFHNAKNNIESGNTIPQRIARDAIDNPISILDGAEEITLAKDLIEGVNLGRRTEKAATFEINKIVGKDFEKAVVKDVKNSGEKDVSEQLTVKAANGTKTRIDVASKTEEGTIKLREAKGSATAPLTKNQKSAHPSIEKDGGVVAGKGKPGFPGGTPIPPTKVEVVKPQ